MGALRGSVPQVVFIWYLLISVVFIAVVGVVVFWYGIVFGIVNGSNTSEEALKPYKPIINKVELEHILNKYNL